MSAQRDELPGGHEPGDCFEAALMFITSRRWEGDDEQRFTLCHGVVKSTMGYSDGIEHVHAWVEEDLGAFVVVHNVARSQPMTLPRAMYYSVGHIDPARVVRYTAREAAITAVDVGTYGPWDDGLNRVQDAALDALRERTEP